MSGMDQTGPWGFGPMTGRGMGWCGMSIGWRGRGVGRNLGHFYGWNETQSKVGRKAVLTDYRKALREKLDEVDNVLADL